MKLSTDYKWRRLRRWVKEQRDHEAAKVPQQSWTADAAYHRNRLDVFKAVLIVMDMENRRARKRKSAEAEAGDCHPIT